MLNDPKRKPAIRPVSTSLITVNQLADEMGINPKSARARLRRKLGKRHEWKFKRRDVPMIREILK